MRHEFARRMEREAEELACGFGDTIDGVKPWYSYAGLFDGPTTRVFVGLNPGEPPCRLCGFADYSLPGLTCGICREPLTGDRHTLAGNRRKAQAQRDRVRLGRCVRCGTPAAATYCPQYGCRATKCCNGRSLPC